MTVSSVRTTPVADANIANAFHFIHADSPAAAERWLLALYRDIDSLERFPKRCPSAPEARQFNEDFRQYLQRPYRIIFRVEKTPRLFVSFLSVTWSNSRRASRIPTDPARRAYHENPDRLSSR